ncbi:MAG: hypothetical protein LBD37_08965 [Treponema sp.]|jgi:hypothetical protein|nr:hypothetical protein [Treponema sp.]
MEKTGIRVQFTQSAVKPQPLGMGGINKQAPRESLVALMKTRPVLNIPLRDHDARVEVVPKKRIVARRLTKPRFHKAGGRKTARACDKTTGFGTGPAVQ